MQSVTALAALPLKEFMAFQDMYLWPSLKMLYATYVAGLACKYMYMQLVQIVPRVLYNSASLCIATYLFSDRISSNRARNTFNGQNLN